MFFSSQNTSDSNDVLVTGIGLVTPLGIGGKLSWQRLIAGDRAGRVLTEHDIDHFDALSELLQREPGGAPVNHNEVAEAVTRSTVIPDSSLPRDFQCVFGADCLNNLVAVSLADALADAQLDLREFNSERTGCVIGTSKPSLRSIETEFQRQADGSERAARCNPWESGFLPDSPLRAIQYLTGATGPASCPVAACATGLLSVIEGASFIQSGMCDVCFAGSADASLRASVLAAFHRLGVTSRGADPRTACRPFDVQRDGFIIGEGAAILILESRSSAEARGAAPYAELAGGLCLSDCTGMTQINPDGTVVAEVIKRLECPDVDFISLHGTGTETNDQAESRGIASASATADSPGFSVKGALGHLLGAAGSVETGLALLALRDDRIPGTANFSTSDKQCPINVSPDTQQVRDLNTALKLSLGFGGHIAGCLIRAL